MNQRKCDLCGRSISPRNWIRHAKSCHSRRRKQQAKQHKQWLDRFRRATDKE